MIDRLEYVKNKKFDVEQWNDKSKDNLNELLAYVCAFWTLFHSKEVEFNEKGELVYRKLHASQIYAIFFMFGFDKGDSWKDYFQGKKQLESHIVELKTGEGKSIVLGIVSTVLALMNYDVHCTCYSQYLSDRDNKDFSDFFKEIGVYDKIYYGTFNEVSEKLINKQCDIRQKTLDCFFQNDQITKQDNDRQTVLLIDEVDVFFSSQFYGQCYNPSTLLQLNEINKIVREIWNGVLVNQQETTILNDINQSGDLKILIQKFPKLELFFKSNIRQMVSCAKQVYEKKHEYIIEEGKIGYKQNEQISFDIWYGYLTTFAYYQEFTNKNVNEEQINRITGISIQCGHLSYAQIPFKYTKILGVTGTLQSLHEESQNILKKYIQAQTTIPSMFGLNKLKFDQKEGVIVVNNQDEQFICLQREIEKQINRKRPVLVFFKDENSLKDFYESGQYPIAKEQVQILNQTSKNKENIISKATRSGQLTLVDRSFGRGTDFVCKDKIANQNGGVVIIQTYLSEDYSEEVQIKGRTARQSNEGQYILIINSEDIQSDFHLKQSDIEEKMKVSSEMYNYLNERRNKLWGENIGILEESIQKAQEKHKQTEDYIKYLQKKQIDQALKQIVKFNNMAASQNSQAYSFYFILDYSGSMNAKDIGNQSRWQFVIQAIETFVNQRTNLGISQDKVSTIIYSNKAQVIMKEQKLQDVMSILSKINNPNGGTIFYNAIDKALELFDSEQPDSNNQPFKKIVLFLSDGGDQTQDYKKLPNSLQKLKDKHQNYINYWWNMGFGPQADGGVLKQMTEWMKDCGGQYKTAVNASDLQQEFITMAQPEAQAMKNR